VVDSVYDRIGGQASLVAVVDDFYDRVLADERLAGFFTGTVLSRLKSRQVEFFAAALGGPAPYRGASMRGVHHGLGITQEHFDLVAGHLVAALGAAGVDEPTVGEIVGAIAPLADDIVSAAADTSAPYGRSHGDYDDEPASA
jgi:hemoglobin